MQIFIQNGENTMRFRNLFSLFVFVFALVTGTFQASVLAVEESPKETISVIGDQTTGIILSETVVEYEENRTALDLLLKTVGENNVKISESTYGKMITDIQGLEAEGNYYWAFYINGISAQLGADQYIVQKGDRISFQYVDWTVAPAKTVTIKISGPNGVMQEASNIAFIDEPSAFDLLKVVLGDKLEYTESQYGKMITSIDGLKMEGKFYWAFYINSKMATVGADSFKLKAGDRISFQYESWETPKEDVEDQNNLPVSGTYSKDKLQISVDRVSQYVVKNQVGEWEAIALRQAGKTLPKDYLQTITKLIQDKNGKFSKITDYERYTLGVLAAGGDPTNIAGHNLVEAIYNGEITKQGLNGVFYSLIALDSGEYEVPEHAKWTRGKLINYLLERQNEDFGWSWDGSSKSDIDTTAMVLTALSPYKEQEEVKKAIDVAVEYLSSQYLAGKIDNSSTAAQVVIGLSAIGIDANDKSLFTKNGMSLIAYLLTFQNNDGGFDWQGGNISDVFSTGQGIQGIVSYQLFLNNKGSLYQLPLTSNVDSKTETSNDSENTVDEGQEGKPLPNTATQTFNFLAFGFFLLILGVIFMTIERRKKA
jgi:translation initiation factor 1 (eIF-1/SUI1)